jgi:PAS domain-containing protein
VQNCLADEAMDSGESTRKEVEIDGTIWDTWWVPVEKDIYLYYAIDITDIRKTKDALHESEERYRRVVNTMRDGLVIASKDGKIQFVNSAFCEMHQYSEEELIGTHVLKVIHPDNHHLVEQMAKELKEKGAFSGGTVEEED